MRTDGDLRHKTILKPEFRHTYMSKRIGMSSISRKIQLQTIQIPCTVNCSKHYWQHIRDFVRARSDRSGGVGWLRARSANGSFPRMRWRTFATKINAPWQNIKASLRFLMTFEPSLWAVRLQF